MTTDTIGGVFSFSVDLARGLAARGVEIYLATLGPAPDRAQLAELRGIRGLELFESHFALEWMADPWLEVDASSEWLLALAESCTPNLIHLNGYCHAALPWRAPVVLVAHSCVLSFWEAAFGEAAPERYDEYRRRVARGLRAADVVITPTRAMLAALTRHYGPVPHARVIGNGADPARWPPAHKEPFYLAAGRFRDPAKNLDLLEAVAGRLPWPIRVAGDAPAQSTELELLGRLSQRDLARAMGQAAIFVHPARYEPFGLAPLEAALAGAALLLSDIDSLREVWGDSALYFHPHDSEALVAAARFLARSERLRLKFAGFARRRAAEYSSVKSSAAYAALYAELLWNAPKAAGAIEGHP